MFPEFTSPIASLILVATAAYMLGSVPFGVLIAKAMGLGNLREIGSGNIGATNVLRTGNKLAAFLTLVLDAGKGAVAVIFAQQFFDSDAAQIAGLFAFLGHLFPVWLQFKGGKGVASFLGILLALNPLAGLGACLVWLLTAVIFRISSLAAILSAISAPIFLHFLLSEPEVYLIITLGVLILIRHGANIKRLFKGIEPKIGSKKKAKKS